MENASFCLVVVDKPNLPEMKKDADIQFLGWSHLLYKAMISIILKYLKKKKKSLKPAPVVKGRTPFVSVS